MFSVGDRVKTSGKGRTSRWGDYYGQVTAVSVNGLVIRVQWDSSVVEDDMDEFEVQPE